MAIAPQEVSPARFSAQLRSHALQTRIMELILEQGLDVGDALPTEGELSAALGVGRNTVRESLKVLQALGVIEIRHGFGTFVAPNNFHALADGSPSGAGSPCATGARRPWSWSTCARPLSPG